MSSIPKLIQLLKERKERAKNQNPIELNYWTFRLGVTLQDLAQLKIEIGKAEDSTYHLQASEEQLNEVRVDEE